MSLKRHKMKSKLILEIVTSTFIQASQLRPLDSTQKKKFEFKDSKQLRYERKRAKSAI